MLVELKNGKRRNFPSAVAKVLLRKGLGVEVADEAPVAEEPVVDNTYQTRMMQAAPYGYKADGTPRLRPGRVAKEV